MKRLCILAAMVTVMLSGGLVLAQQGKGQGQGSGPQGQGWFCPWCGQSNFQGRGMGPGMMGQGQGGQGMRPDMMYGQGMMHGQQGMMRGQGMHRGQGMMHGKQQGMSKGCPFNQQKMHPGWGRGQYGPQGGQQQPVPPMNADQARQLAENYVAGNPNLKVGQITEKGDQAAFAATIVTQDGSLVEKLLIDKQTGWMKRQY